MEGFVKFIAKIVKHGLKILRDKFKHSKGKLKGCSPRINLISSRKTSSQYGGWSKLLGKRKTWIYQELRTQ